jgi:hypothetical protein
VTDWACLFSFVAFIHAHNISPLAVIMMSLNNTGAAYAPGFLPPIGQ